MCDLVLLLAEAQLGKNIADILDLKPPPCSECCMLSSGLIPRRLNFICRSFGKHCSIFTGVHTHPPMKMEQSVFRNVGI
jgi:hypothetical protein